jgi:hypothetical protein
MLQYRGE